VKCVTSVKQGDAKLNNLIILSKNADEYCRLLEAEHLPDLNIINTATDPDQIASGSPGNILFGDSTLVSMVLDKLPQLQWVQTTWAGVEPLLKQGLRRDYHLTNARVLFGPLMSEYVFAYLLLHERRILQRYEAQQKQVWDASITGSLRGKTIGLLGVGSIAVCLASTAKQFGMRVRGYSRTSRGCKDVDQYFQGADLQEFTLGLDYLINSLPNTSETRHLVNSEMLGWLPSHAVFVNVGRGSTVDESALDTALSKGKIAGAVLDVFEQEPLPQDHIFWKTPNLFITSHTAAPSLPIDLTKLFIENYHRYSQNLPLHHLVDFERGY
jgi:phosphoglycerate dehydrogenase-like enzyme